MDREQKSRVKKWIAPWLMVILVIVAVLPQPATALPPRPEANRGSSQAGSDGHGDGSEAGAFIELHVQPAQPGAWVTVQWLDNSGNWIDVEGWSGVIEENKPVLWWVKEADFGKGPFRWAVYTDSGNSQVLASDEFYLPRQVGETLPVRITVLPTPTPSPSPTPIQVLMVESIPAPVTANETLPVQEGFTTITPTLEAPPSPTSSPAPEPAPTFTPTLTPSPGLATVLPVSTSTPLPPAASNPSTIEVVLSPTPNSVEAVSEEVLMANGSAFSLSVTQAVSPSVVNEKERGGGFLSPATALGKGVWGSAILVFGTLILIGVKRVRNRPQNRRQEQLP